MSYILDALKKAERERGLARVPTLTTVHELRDPQRTRPWIIAGVIAFCAAALSVLLLMVFGVYVWPPEPSQITSKPAGSEILPETIPHREETPAAQQPQAAVAAAARDSAARKTEIAPKANPQELNPDLLKTQHSQLPASDLSGQAPEPGSTPATAMSLREAADKMSLSILMYSDNPAERLVFINGSKYLEGDYVEGPYLLESITQDGAVLSHGGERMLLRPGSR